MATGIVASGTRGLKRCVILSAAVPDAENEVEVSYQLPKDMRAWLAAASETCLTIVAGTEVGAATFAVESLVESRDDTNWRTVEDFADVTISAAGEYRINLTKHVMAEYVKMMIGTVTLSAGAYFPLEIALECTVDPSKYGA